jgi:hypothetical protein
MLKTIADPSCTTPELSVETLDVMRDTSFEDHPPQPLPEETRVAHKIGSYGNTFSDAGVVFPEGSQATEDAYFIVVMARDTARVDRPLGHTEYVFDDLQAARGTSHPRRSHDWTGHSRIAESPHGYRTLDQDLAFRADDSR